MPTIMVDPDDADVISGLQMPGWQPKRVVDCLDEPIHEEGSPCVLDGRPCILFGMWDYAEDWSGEYVRELHPFVLIGKPKLSTVEFWELVRRTHKAEGPENSNARN